MHQFTKSTETGKFLASEAEDFRMEHSTETWKRRCHIHISSGALGSLRISSDKKNTIR